MPTKSAVFGLLGAAQGLARDDTDGLARLAALRFGVRTDKPDTLLRDIHTAPGRTRTRTRTVTDLQVYARSVTDQPAPARSPTVLPDRRGVHHRRRRQPRAHHEDRRGAAQPGRGHHVGENHEPRRRSEYGCSGVVPGRVRTVAARSAAAGGAGCPARCG
ncbi:CRISPR-associated protein Cas5 [Kitasatospora purpeofusca]|uniref:CRISPR-associated protein Cas5 n=1 Tax=Kitasatospora purpeofusca TaxID=67352 RepID=UPI0038666CAC